MFEQAFKNIDDALRKESGCTTELDYTEQTSWLLFLKYLDGLEEDKASEAILAGKKHSYILSAPYRWDTWAAPKDKDGKLDQNKAMTGDDLVKFVDESLFPYLHGFKQRAAGPATIEYKIGEIFGEIKNKIRSGYTLRDIIDHVDELRFRSQIEKHELSMLYEEKIKRMGNAGRNGGEYYTPRPLIRAMIQVVQPKIGERIYDGACGSAGFLCEAFDYLKEGSKLSTSDLKKLQETTFYGVEKKSLAYVIAIMNMILHGIETPNVAHANTLSINLADIQEKDRFEVVLANPPFGGKERKEVRQNFPIHTGETASLFLQHFIKVLKSGGRAAIVIKDTFLSNSDNASISVRKYLLNSCNVRTILSCPKGTFLGTGEKTVILFFEKGSPTQQIWYYELSPDRSLGKSNPLNDDDLLDFLELQRCQKETPKSWIKNIKNIDVRTYELSAKNPNPGIQPEHNLPHEIADELISFQADGEAVLKSLCATGKVNSTSPEELWQEKSLGEILKLEYGKPLDKVDRDPNGLYPVYGANGEKTRTNRFYFGKPSIIVGRKGSAGEINLTEEKFWPLDVTYFVTFDETQYDLRFLYYLLRTLDLPKMARGVKPGINRNDVYAKIVKVPGLDKQKEIVQQLDEYHDLKEDFEQIQEKISSKIRDLEISLNRHSFPTKYK